MAFAASDFRELIALLETHPDWRSELRQLLATDDLSDLRPVLRQLAEAQQRTEERLANLAEQVQQLAERVDQLTRNMNRLAETVILVERDLGELKGMGLEQRYRTHASAYFRPLLRRIRVVTDEELSDLMEDAEGRGIITEPEAASVEAADVVLRGRRVDDREEAYLAAEISWIVDGHDVERAAERAAILTRATGKPSIAVVAGRSMSDRAVARARELGVRSLIDGRAGESASRSPA